MKVGNYFVKWFHENNQEINYNTGIFQKMDYRGEKNHKPKPSKTVCQIIGKDQLGSDAIIAYGVAICKPSNNFCKYEGRKRSMRRALTAFSDKPTRKLFWDTFRGVLPK
jgi:hypothetical protein